MSAYLPFLVAGLTAGSVYSLGAVGLVITYKTSRIFNFSYGALATIGAYVFYALHVQNGMAWPLAALISVVGVGVVLGLVFEPFARVLASRSLVEQVVATVGVLLAVQAICIVTYGVDARIFPSFLSTRTFHLAGANVSVSQIVTVVLVLVATAVLYCFFRWARIGVAMRAVVDNADLLDIAGTSPQYVRRWAWIIGCVFATLSGVLLAPSLELNPQLLSLLVVDSFGAAALGAFTNLPMAYVGGLVIGVVGGIFTKFSGSSQVILAGMAPSLPFIALFVASLALPRRWLVAHQRMVPRRSSWSMPPRLQLAAGVAVLVVLCFIPQMVGNDTTSWTQLLIYVILFLSLGLLVRTAGQVSLCQFTFAAIGAAAFAHIEGPSGAGVPWLPALLLAGLVAVPIGALLAIPAIRLGGLYLALATFGFGILVQGMFYTSGLMFGAGGVSEPLPSLSWLNVSSPTGYYYVVLSIAVVCTAIIVILNRTRLGRLLQGMADSSLALSTNGTSVNVTHVLVFSLSAFFAAIAGALLGANVSLASATLFNPTTSLELIAVVLISLGGAPWYALLAAAGIVVVPTYLTSGTVPYYLQILFGVSAVAFCLGSTPAANAKLVKFMERIGGRRRPAALDLAKRPSGAVTVRKSTVRELQVEGLQVAFGGLVAVDGLSLTAPVGRVTGLIGPNGAGKTTTFNACSGLVRPSAGRVVLDGRDITAMPPAARARLGLGRTFQQMQLFDSLTVAQNVALGREASQAGISPLTQLVTAPGDSPEVKEAAADAMALCGIEGLAGTLTGALSTGQRRLVELARCLAGPYAILLLDEPSSGLDHSETEEFGSILRRVVDQRGVGILLVEHDMSLVMDVCSHIYVMDFGTPIFEGSPTEVAHSAIVQAAYLGAASELNSSIETGLASA